MARTFRDAIDYDAANVFLNTDEFADTITLTHPDSAGSTMSPNQMLSALEMMPVPDGDVDSQDRLQLLGLYRLGDVSTAASSVTAIVDFDNLDVIQGMGLDTEFGRRVEEFGVLELDIDTVVYCDLKPELCSYVTIDGNRWSCVRQLGRDSGMQSVAILRQSKVTTKRGRAKP